MTEVIKSSTPEPMLPWKFNSLIPIVLAAWLYYYVGGPSHHKLRMLSQGCNPSLSRPAAGTHSCVAIREGNLI